MMSVNPIHVLLNWWYDYLPWTWAAFRTHNTHRRTNKKPTGICIESTLYNQVREFGIQCLNLVLMVCTWIEFTRKCKRIQLEW